MKYPPPGCLKFNVDGAGRGKLGPANTSDVLRYGAGGPEGAVGFGFRSMWVSRILMRWRRWRFLELLHSFTAHFHDRYIAENNSSNAIFWMRTHLSAFI